MHTTYSIIYILCIFFFFANYWPLLSLHTLTAYNAAQNNCSKPIVDNGELLGLGPIKQCNGIVCHNHLVRPNSKGINTESGAKTRRYLLHSPPL